MGETILCTAWMMDIKPCRTLLQERDLPLEIHVDLVLQVQQGKGLAERARHRLISGILSSSTNST
jgi:hypothetical protein